MYRRVGVRAYRRKRSGPLLGLFKNRAKRDASRTPTRRYADTSLPPPIRFPSADTFCYCEFSLHGLPDW
jgi:hypothetical protein